MLGWKGPSWLASTGADRYFVTHYLPLSVKSHGLRAQGGSILFMALGGSCLLPGPPRIRHEAKLRHELTKCFISWLVKLVRVETNHEALLTFDVGV